MLAADPILWGIKKRLSFSYSLYKNRNEALETIQSLPILLMNRQTSPINLKMFADTVKDHIWNRPVLQSRKNKRDKLNYLRSVKTGKWEPKLFLEEKLPPFLAQWRCKFSPLSSLGSKNPGPKFSLPELQREDLPERGKREDNWKHTGQIKKSQKSSPKILVNSFSYWSG